MYGIRSHECLDRICLYFHQFILSEIYCTTDSPILPPVMFHLVQPRHLRFDLIRRPAFYWQLSISSHAFAEACELVFHIIRRPQNVLLDLLSHGRYAEEDAIGAESEV